MKNVRIIPGAVLLFLLAFSCAKNQEPDPVPETVDQVFRAEILDERARTTITDDLTAIQWSQNDEIGIFDGTSSTATAVKAQIDNSTLSQPMALFNPVKQINHPSYAYHPFVESQYTAGLETDGLWITTGSPDGSFNSANVMVAPPGSNNNLQFKNVVGIFRIVVNNNNARKIQVDAPGIAGRMHVAFQQDGSVTVTPDSQNKSDQVTVNINGSGTYYIPVRPGDYAAGSIVFTLKGNSNNTLSTATFPRPLSVSRNQVIDWTDPFQLINLAVSKITCQGREATLDPATGTFTLTLPTETQFSDLVCTFTYNGSTITANGEPWVSGQTHLNARGKKGSRDGEYVVDLLCDGKKYYKLVVRNTGLPVVTVVTQDGKPANQAITSKDTWVDGITLRVDDADGTSIFKTDPDKAKGENQYCQMKGRGNTTWEWFDKKPYAIKLEKKAGLVEGEKGKRWILLANFKDRTLLRNDAAFWLSKKSGLPYTVRGMFVELVFNGEHRGNYYLCEQIKPAKNRVNITEMEDNEAGAADQINITGGFLMEADIHNDEGVNAFKIGSDNYWGWNNSSFYYNIKEPDVEVTSQAARDYIKGYLTTLESSLSDNTNHTWNNYLDINSAIDYFLMQELTSNDDFYNGGVHSTYMYKDRNTRKNDQEVVSKVFLGPIWDFDFSTFLPSRANFWSAKEGNDYVFYYKKLMADATFRSALVARWNEYKEKFHGLPAYMDAMAEKIRLSEEFNHQMWPQAGVNHANENGEANMTFDEALANIKNGFLAKWSWLDTNINALQ